MHRRHKRLPGSFFHNTGDIPSNACRVHAVLLVMLHLTDAPGDAPAVFIIAENAFLTCFCKTGTDVTQFYDGNMDAVGLDFIFQSIRIRRNSSFACRVEGLEWNVCYLLSSVMYKRDNACCCTTDCHQKTIAFLTKDILYTVLVVSGPLQFQLTTKNEIDFPKRGCLSHFLFGTILKQPYSLQMLLVAYQLSVRVLRKKRDQFIRCSV